MNGESKPESEIARRLRKGIEKLEAFRLSCKQAEAGAEELEKFFREEIAHDAKPQ